MKHIFLTGATGFVGHNIIIKLKDEKDVRVHCLTLPNDPNIKWMSKAYNFIDFTEGSILSKEDMDNFFSKKVEGERIVIHCAAKISIFKRNDKECTLTNVEGTKNVAEASMKYGCDRFIYVSSVDAFDRRGPNMVKAEQDEYHPDLADGVYSKSKAAASQYLLDLYKEKNFPVILIQPSGIMGPNDNFAAPLNLAIKKFVNGKLPAIVNGGYDIVDVRDVADGIISSITKGRLGQSYIVGGTPIQVLDLIAIAAKVENRKPVKATVPHWVIKMISPVVELSARMRHKPPLFTGFSMDCLKLNPIYDCSKAIKELGYKKTPIEETMRDTIQWMKESGYLTKKN